MEDTAFIKPPEKIPFYLKIGLLISRVIVKKDLLAPRLLAWYPKAAIGSAALEALVAHGKGDLNKRILKLVRIQVSLSVACPFCIDMNSFEYKNDGLSEAEIKGLMDEGGFAIVASFSAKEKLALEYANLISQTPVVIPEEFIKKLKADFTEREIVILATTAAQVNYWARLLKSLGVPPAGFSDSCSIKNRQ
ncbi:MAG: carboxymuconolactone decarboxylase family protein [Acholeplasmataceae bacterium]|nr:carboxymuconolactone decarboxylase family protein [Acholeplasmataceae bacterium]